MSEQVQAQQRGGYGRAVPWFPLRRSLEAWSQVLPALLFGPHISGSRPAPGEQHWWRIVLDVAHFTPSEISLRVRDSFLEVTGEHEERPDEYGFTARRFMRKYRLPAEADIAKMVSTLSDDGILTVEAPVPETSLPALTIIPIKVEMEDEKGKGPGMLPGDSRAPEHPVFPAAEGGEVRALEDHSHDGQPGSASTGLQEEEESSGEPAGELHQDEGSGTDALKLAESEVLDEDVPEGPGEAAEEASQLGKGTQREEDQELKDQEQEDQGLKVQEQEDQGLKDQEQKDQEQEDQEQKDQQEEDLRFQKDHEQEDQEKEDQELKDQKQEDQEKEDPELKDQEKEDQELGLKDHVQGDQELKDQEQKDQGLKDQEQEDQGMKDQEQEDQGLKDQEQDNQEQEDQEKEDQELKDQKQKDQEKEDQKQKEQEQDNPEIKQDITE